MTSRLNRRNALRGIASASVLGLAGCLSGDREPTEEGNHNESDDEHHEDEDSHEDDHSDHNHGNDLPEEPVSEANARMYSDSSGEHFDPHVVWVEEGGTVTWENASGSHSTTAYHPDNDRPLRQPEDTSSWDSGVLVEEGATFEHTFETPGVYQFVCTPHEDLGMIGAVIVGHPDPHGQPGLAEPQDSFSETAAAQIKDLNEMCNKVLGHTH